MASYLEKVQQKPQGKAYTGILFQSPDPFRVYLLTGIFFQVFFQRNGMPGVFWRNFVQHNIQVYH